MARKKVKTDVAVNDGVELKYEIDGIEYNCWKDIYENYPQNKYCFIRKSNKVKKTVSKKPKNTSKYQKGDKVKVYGVEFTYNGERFLNKYGECGGER